MEKNRNKKFIKIIVIIAIILTIISIILPWGMFSYSAKVLGQSIKVDADFYPWGLHVKVGFSSIFINHSSKSNYEIWSFLYSEDLMISDPDFQNLISNLNIFSEEMQEKAFLAFLINFILCITTIILGLFAMTRKNICLTAGIISLFSILSFIASITILKSYESTDMLAEMIGYSIGLFLMIVVMILFFIAFALHMLVPKMPLLSIAPQTYPTYQPPPQISQQKKAIYPPTIASPAIKKFCPKCGSPLSSNPEFCPNCGARLR